jgi:hypothetical protein
MTETQGVDREWQFALTPTRCLKLAAWRFGRSSGPRQRVGEPWTPYQAYREVLARRGAVSRDEYLQELIGLRNYVMRRVLGETRARGDGAGGQKEEAFRQYQRLRRCRGGRLVRQPGGELLHRRLDAAREYRSILRSWR